MNKSLLSTKVMPIKRKNMKNMRKIGIKTVIRWELTFFEFVKHLYVP